MAVGANLAVEALVLAAVSAHEASEFVLHEAAAATGAEKSQTLPAIPLLHCTVEVMMKLLVMHAVD
jgi:hypothetical protein